MMNYNKLAFDFCPAPIVVLSNRCMMEMNVAFTNLFGYTREELIEQSIVKIFPSIEDYEKVGDDALPGRRYQAGLIQYGRRSQALQQKVFELNRALAPEQA